MVVTDVTAPPPRSPGRGAYVRLSPFRVFVAAFLLLFMWQVPPWLVVILCALGGAALAAV